VSKIKWYLVAFLIGAILGAGIVLITLYCPSSRTIADLRAESDRASQKYRAELDRYTGLLAEARNRAGELAEDLGRATEEYQAALERVEQLEGQARDLQELIGEIQESGGRATQYNQRIRGEAETALESLREYRAALAAGLDGGGGRDPPAED